MEKDRKLTREHPTQIPRAIFKQSPDMFFEEYIDETTGTARKKVKEELIVVEADSRGRLYLEKGQEDLVKRILNTLRRVDESIKLDETGLQLPETKEVNKGGRPRKADQIVTPD